MLSSWECLVMCAESVIAVVFLSSRIAQDVSIRANMYGVPSSVHCPVAMLMLVI